MNRPLPSGRLTVKEAVTFGTIVTLVGLLALCWVHWLVVGLAVATWISYVAVYTPLKRKTTLSLLVGGVPGAIPTLGGWVAASGSFQLGGVLLFLVLFFWQLPHFLSLSWIYKHDYARGGFKMLAVLDETGKTLARQTIAYVVLLTVATLGLTFAGLTGWIYTVGSLALCGHFFYAAARFLYNVTPVNARKVLMASYLYLLGVIMLIFADKI